MFGEIVTFVLLLSSGASVLWLVYVVTGQFNKASIKLQPWEIALLSVPLIAVLVGIWRIFDGSTIRLEAAVTLLMVFIVMSTIPTRWDQRLVAAWKSIKQNKEDVAVTVVVSLITVACAYLMFEFLGAISHLLGMLNQKWNEVPRSERYFLYGLGVVGLMVAGIIGIYAINHRTPQVAVALAKLFATIMCCAWALCWILAIFYGFLEKIGAMQ